MHLTRRSALARFAALTLAGRVRAAGKPAFEMVKPGQPLVFPRDHGPHPMFRSEWWYLTANLSAADGTAYGVQWTLFRSALAPGGAPDDQIWFGHAAISAPGGHFAAERFGRGGTGQAGATALPFEAHVDEWELKGGLTGALTLFAQGTDFAYQMTFSAEGPLVLEGDRGYSLKTANGPASYYYSQPFLTGAGTLTLPSGAVDVSGSGWFDREWSSAAVLPDQIGWDWIGLHFDGGERLMGYRVRDEKLGSHPVGTWIEADGTPHPLPPDALTMTPGETADASGHRVPVVWRVTLPARGLDVTLRAIYPDSWMPTTISYWEGPVTVTGSHPGVGYLEMTGYD